MKQQIPSVLWRVHGTLFRNIQKLATDKQHQQKAVTANMSKGQLNLEHGKLVNMQIYQAAKCHFQLP